ncbi:G5 domain-containing protein [Streptococcus acidominimus]|uniref:Phage protein n=1 Tax=Streptococcus acidominimus TaxID=1326 RepID=A0A1Q8EFY5_STRAI|nr:G5 domain-containing protein [Streptococcus acidominimus]OLF50666.1 hypothetical protein BU200_01205 [Streptococcus acidominimus]QBX13688.1 hypothetical protein Javan1_0048 [Streptococcus phage Javan1]SUN05011.1 phage protein [Streptococcus acidominimus]SUN41200.1 phage protein [Streptococcus acidominimus]
MSKISKNSTSLVQIEGGKIIKQNDYSSNFAYELRDEHKEKIPALDGKEAKIVLVKELEAGEIKAVYETVATVVDGKVEFTITETLEPALYYVEIACGGYIFPSENSVTIEVTKSAFGKSEPKVEPDPEVDESEVERIEEVAFSFDEEVIEDSSLYIGEEVVEQEGEEGLARQILKGDVLISEELLKEPVKRIVRKGTKLHKHIAYANIAKGDNLAESNFFENTLGDGMSKELADGKQLITSSSLHGAVTYSTLNDVQAGSYEILIKARKTSDKVTDIRFGFENFDQMQEFSDISSEMTEYSFVATVPEDRSAMYYHFRTDGSVELESVQIRKVTVSNLSWEDAGQSHVGVTQSSEKEIPLEFNRFKWSERG